jgi:SAM-dependent methyltransferase
MIADEFIKILQCPRCLIELAVSSEYLQCPRCHRIYRRKNKTVFFMSLEEAPNVSTVADNIIFKLKSKIKEYPAFFHILNHILGAYVGKSARQAIKELPTGSYIINIGSGAEIVREDVINVDCTAYPGVAVVADVHHLPFKDKSVDAVIAESVLEHTQHPASVIDEILRILKPDGLVYITTPFIIGFHSSPGDYYRWTASGLRELLRDFQEQELGVAVGPTNALTYILREWLALILSFGSGFLHQCWVLFFMVIFAPLNFMDYLLARFRRAENIAHIFYFIGHKKQ